MPEGAGDTDSGVLRRHYRERDYLTSPDGLMKLLAVVLCIVSAVMLLNATCGAAGAPLRAAGAALELAAAAALAVLSAARLLHLAVYAPLGWFYGDLVVSTVTGILVLVTAVLSLTLCDTQRAADYVHGLVGLVNAGLVTGSAVVAYVTATRRWDAARRPAAPPPRASSEQDV